MKKNKFIKYAGVGLGLLGATMSLSYGEIDLNKCLMDIHGEKVFYCLSKDLQGEDAEKVLNFLIAQKKNIKEIKIYDCLIGDGFVKNFKDVLTNNPTLESLCVSYTPKFIKIKYGSLTALAEALQGCTSLKKLSLDNNKIGEEIAIALAKALQGNQTLEELDLSKNKITDEVARKIEALLWKNTKLRSIRLDRDGGEEKSPKASQKKIELRLDENQIGDGGEEKSQKASQENIKLESLTLHDIQIGDAGAKALADALKDNIKLESLTLHDIQIGDKVAKASKDARKKPHRSDENLYLYDYEDLFSYDYEDGFDEDDYDEESDEDLFRWMIE